MKRVERLADSGLTAREFAAEIGVNANTLAGWRWRLGSRQGGGSEAREQGRRGPTPLEIVGAPEDAPANRAAAPRGQRTPRGTTGAEAAEAVAPMQFVELTTKTSATSTRPASFEIVLRSGQVVRVPGGFDAAELVRLVGLLEEVRS